MQMKNVNNYNDTGKQRPGKWFANFKVKAVSPSKKINPARSSSPVIKKHLVEKWTSPELPDRGSPASLKVGDGTSDDLCPDVFDAESEIICKPQNITYLSEGETIDYMMQKELGVSMASLPPRDTIDMHPHTSHSPNLIICTSPTARRISSGKKAKPLPKVNTKQVEVLHSYVRKSLFSSPEEKAAADKLVLQEKSIYQEECSRQVVPIVSTSPIKAVKSAATTPSNRGPVSTGKRPKTVAKSRSADTADRQIGIPRFMTSALHRPSKAKSKGRNASSSNQHEKMNSSLDLASFSRFIEPELPVKASSLSLSRSYSYTNSVMNASDSTVTYAANQFGTMTLDDRNSSVLNAVEISWDALDASHVATCSAIVKGRTYMSGNKSFLERPLSHCEKKLFDSPYSQDMQRTRLDYKQTCKKKKKGNNFLTKKTDN